MVHWYWCIPETKPAWMSGITSSVSLDVTDSKKLWKLRQLWNITVLRYVVFNYEWAHSCHSYRRVTSINRHIHTTPPQVQWEIPEDTSQFDGVSLPAAVRSSQQKSIRWKFMFFSQFSHVVTCTFRENLGKLLKKSWLSIQSTHRILYESIGFHRISHEMGWWIYEPRCQAQRRFATERDAKLEATTLGIFLGGKTEGCFPSADLDWNKNGRYWEIIGCSIRKKRVSENDELKPTKKRNATTHGVKSHGGSSDWMVNRDIH